MVSLAQIQAFCSISYDYVLVGGGSASLAVAARLSENPKATVAVLEAGPDHSEDPKVLIPGLGTSMLGDPSYDWSFITQPQVHPACGPRLQKAHCTDN